MVYGPCGGVRPDGRCEMAAFPCVFDRLNEVTPPGPGVPRPAVTAPLVLTDLSVPPADASTLRATAKILAASSDALLVGDHQDRVDFPPSMLARLIADAGARPWVTLACRDRNRVSLEQELHALRHDGVATVLCVTGDGRAYDVRPDVTQAFDLDGTRLAALAAESVCGSRWRRPHGADRRRSDPPGWCTSSEPGRRSRCSTMSRRPPTWTRS